MRTPPPQTSVAVVGCHARGGKRVRIAPAMAPARREAPAGAPAISAEVIPLKDAKLNIEHNATDEDTGFQSSSTARAGGGSTCVVRTVSIDFPGARFARQARAHGAVFRDGRARERGRPDRGDAGEASGACAIEGPTMENGVRAVARREPRGSRMTSRPVRGLVSPAEGATVPPRGVVARWKPCPRRSRASRSRSSPTSSSSRRTSTRIRTRSGSSG